MKDRGRYQIQFMKTRSSSGVGQKVELEFNLDTLRITDLNEDDQPQSSMHEQRSNPNTFTLKRTSVVTTSSENVDPETGEIRMPDQGATVQKPRDRPLNTALIRSMLPKLNPERD
jgi:hypothetical protein